MRMAPMVVLSPEQRRELERYARGRRVPLRLVQRSQALLLAAEGKRNTEIAQTLGVGRDTVAHWRSRFRGHGLAGIERDAPRPGRKPTIDKSLVAAIVRKTTQETPAGATQWSTRSMAREVGISEASVRRIWRRHGLKPHRVRSFKLSNDPNFAEKLRDIVGLYLNPPERALVLSLDEKSQIQALDRTQPGLPMKKGRLGTMTHDYKRHGTTTLFAALDVATGSLLQDCMPHHRHQEFLKFMRQMEQSVASDLEIHVILDNYATHKHPKVKRWLARHRRVHFHFTPTSASWLNLVERFFSELTERRIRRLAVTSVDQLIAAITAYIDQRNEHPVPFVWTATVQQILKKVNKANQTLATLH